MIDSINVSAADLTTFGIANQVLIGHGIGAAGATPSLSDLAAAIYSRGWAYDISRSGSDFLATIGQSAHDSERFHVAGIGWVPEVALTLALASAITRRRRNDSPVPSESTVNHIPQAK